MHTTTKMQALKALDGMAEIVRAEMIKRGVYITEEVEDPKRVNNLCGGRKACAIGALYLGAGVKPTLDEVEEGVVYATDIPGTDQDFRDGFLRPRHGLRSAYDALNVAATSYIERNEIGEDELDIQFDAPIERLFEGSDNIGKTELLRIIRSAKERIKKA